MSYIRKIGMWAYQDKVSMRIKSTQMKLFLESYFDLSFGVILGSLVFTMTETGETHKFFNNPSNILCSITTLVYLVGIFSFPIYVGHKLITNFENIDDPKF